MGTDKRKFMKKLYRSVLIFAMAVLVGVTASGCGCGKKKEPEAEASQVMKLTITPEVTPTLTPDKMNPAAVERNGNLTMVNEYTAANGGGSVDAAQAEADLEKAVEDSINTDETDSGETDTGEAGDESDENME